MNCQTYERLFICFRLIKQLLIQKNFSRRLQQPDETEEKPMKRTFKLEDLDCANCAAKMEDAISKLPGVTKCSINFMAQKMSVEFEEGADVSSTTEKVLKNCRRVERDCEIEF